MVSITDYELCRHVKAWMLRMEMHDVDLYRHCVRVGDLALRFSAHLGYAPVDCLKLQIGGILHDIGKLNITRDLLHKPGNLNLKEIDLMQRHPEDGYQMLIKEGGYDGRLLAIVRDHHERLDGTGYPRGIERAMIQDEVRIVTLCDIYTAMTEARPYGIRYTTSDALARMLMKGKRLDQKLVNAFATMMVQLEAADAAYGVSDFDAPSSVEPSL